MAIRAAFCHLQTTAVNIPKEQPHAFHGSCVTIRLSIFIESLSAHLALIFVLDGDLS